jgi:nucleotide-binding universal stress UspA family protein
MSYKTILVHVDESRHLDLRVEIAAKIAAQHKAHLVGVAITGLPIMFYDPIAFNPLDPTVAPLLEVPRQRAAAALARFESLALRLKVASIETRLEENEDAEGLVLQARYCDLVVLGQHDPDDPGSTDSDFAETVILKSGVPVLMIPYASAVTSSGERALISWNASKEAKLALHFALPLLERASKVEVAVFDPDTLPSDYRAMPDKSIVEYLARHGINTKVTRQVTAGDIDIGKALLSLTTDLTADLLVMGCYGHARFREILLGGVTREILKSMTVPVLMAH